MKFCTNCGEKLEENAVACAKCGTAVKEKEKSVPATQTPEKKPGGGLATASMVLGIIGIIFGVISLIIALAFAAYMSEQTGYRLYRAFVRDTYQAEKMVASIMIVFLPGILSIIGLPLGIGGHGKGKNGASITGIVLSLITIVICIVDVVMIMSV